MPNDPNAVKRQAQLDALGNPVNTKMPVGQGGDFGRLHGFDANNYNDPNMRSVKYDAGRIMSRYAPKPSELPKVLADPDFKARFPNAKQVGKDGIDFGGAMSDGDTGSPVGLIDVGEAFDDTNDTGNGWWWGWDTGGGQQAVAPNGGIPKNGAPFDALAVNADESLAALIAQLMGQNQRGAQIDALGV